MPRDHGDCTFHDQWLVQDEYKEWVVKDGDQRLARCKKSSMTMAWARAGLALGMAMQLFELPNEFSVLGLAHLRKSVSGHVPVLFMCCEYHF